MVTLAVSPISLDMELNDRIFATNRDWDPTYLCESVSQVWFDFKDLWQSNIGDTELVNAAEGTDKYCPLVKDISLDDETLYAAVQDIENK